MHDIRKPNGYKPLRAKRKPSMFRTLSNGKRIPTFAAMVAYLELEINKA